MERNTTNDLASSGSFVSKYQLEVVEYILESWICSILSYLGIILNTLTIIVFSRMGYKETANISMTAVAVWDIIKCVSIAVTSLTLPMKSISMEWGITWQNVTTIVFRIIKATSSHASGGIAAYVSVERCICVKMPLMVKSLLTRKVVVSACIFISVIAILHNVIIYPAFNFVETTDHQTNLTYIKFVFSDFRKKYPFVIPSVMIMNIASPVISFCIMCVCTSIIVYYLVKWSKIRNSITANSKRLGDLPQNNKSKSQSDHQLSSRDRRAIKMLVVIIIVYIICFAPRIGFFLTYLICPGFNNGLRYNNLYWVCLYIISVFDVVNGSTNIFIFYSTSSLFKSTLHRLFNFGSKDKDGSTTAS